MCVLSCKHISLGCCKQKQHTICLPDVYTVSTNQFCHTDRPDSSHAVDTQPLWDNRTCRWGKTAPPLVIHKTPPLYSETMVWVVIVKKTWKSTSDEHWGWIVESKQSNGGTWLYQLTYSGRRVVARGRHLTVGGAENGDGSCHGGWRRGWEHPGGGVVVAHLRWTLQTGRWGARLEEENKIQLALHCFTNSERLNERHITTITLSIHTSQNSNIFSYKNVYRK